MQHALHDQGFVYDYGELARRPVVSWRKRPAQATDSMN